MQWSKRDVARLVKLIASGYGCRECGEILGTTQEGVQTKVRRLRAKGVSIPPMRRGWLARPKARVLKKEPVLALPIRDGGMIKPPTLAQLMAGR